MLTIITTCKGRLAHLRESLPAMLAQADAEVVLVDYSCPEQCGDWAEATHEAVRIVRVPDRHFFNLADARNRGAAVAFGDWLCFCDADKVLGPSFALELAPSLGTGRFFIAPERVSADMMGLVVCRAEDFSLVEGYDEQMWGWGHEDIDFYGRLRMSGLRSSRTLPAHCRTIAHGADLRARHHAIESPRVSLVLNRLYSQIKRDYLALARQTTMPRAHRRGIYQQAAALMVSALTGESGRGAGAMPPREMRGYRLERQIGYVLELEPGLATQRDLSLLQVIARTGELPADP